MTEALLLVPLGQATEPAMTLFEFILAVLDRPAVSTLLIAIAGLLVWWTKRDLARVETRLDGRLSELVDAQAGRAHAEGKIEGLKEAPPPPPAVVVVPPVVAPPPRSGQERTRASDRPAEPAPPEPPPYDGPPL